MAKIWKVKSETPEAVCQKIINSLKPHLLPGPPPGGEGDLVLLAQMLYNRGITDQDKIYEFLEPKYEKLHSPFLFKDMQKAVDRIWRAIEGKEKICIYGDYDADAVTANAVLQQTFRYLGADVSSYIPDRFSEGYGVNLDALLKIKDEGSRIIITVDCGTNSIDAAEFCAANGIDFIITDHHEIIGDEPKAYALINPKNPKDGYPYSEITGVGVAFKLACGLLSAFDKVAPALSSRNFLLQSASEQAKNIRDPEKSNKLDPGSRLHSAGMTQEKYNGGWEKWLLDLVAIGTVADCHSLLGENRILVKYGLKVLAKTKWIGLRALMESASLLEDGSLGQALGQAKGQRYKPLDTYTLGFVIAPRLNAAGRLEHANIALDLLLEQNTEAAKIKAQALETINSRRQDLTKNILSEAKEKVLLIQERKVLALVGEGWPKGVMGLVAGRLAEEFYKPVIVLERTESVCTGSARTAGEFNLIEALKYSADYLLKFGGHKQAAGLSLDISQFDKFYKKLLDYAEANIGETRQKTLELEAELKSAQCTVHSAQLVSRLEPFGVNNSKPKFLIPSAVVSSARLVGAAGQHLQLKLNVGGREINSIMFNAPDFAKNLKIGDTVDVAAELIEDNWNGNRQIKLRMIDIRPIN